MDKCREFFGVAAELEEQYSTACNQRSVLTREVSYIIVPGAHVPTHQNDVLSRSCTQKH